MEQVAGVLVLCAKKLSVLQGKLTHVQAAEYLGLTSGTLRAYRARGIGPRFTKVGGRVYYDRNDLENWGKERTTEPK